VPLSALLRTVAALLLASVVRPRFARALWLLLSNGCECCARRALELLYALSVSSLLAAIAVTAYALTPWTTAAAAAVVLLGGLGIAALWSLSLLVGEAEG
jgi:hypothetical protein